MGLICSTNRKLDFRAFDPWNTPGLHQPPILRGNPRITLARWAGAFLQQCRWQYPNSCAHFTN